MEHLPRRGAGHGGPSPLVRKRQAAGPDDDDGLAALAGRLKAIYTAARSSWETMRRGVQFEYRPPRSYDTGPPPDLDDEGGHKRKRSVVGDRTWLGIARRFVSLKLDTHDYVYRTFARLGLGQPPEPHELLTPGNQARYDRDRERGGRCVGITLEVQKRTAAAAIHYELSTGTPHVLAHAVVLLDGSTELSPLFRYCLACKLMGELGKDPALWVVRKRYLRPASVQYMRAKRDYDESSWADWLPDGFKCRAVRVYHAAIGLPQEDEE